MARIELRGVAHAYAPRRAPDEPYALAPLDLTFEDGGAYALLGPSGCGKTTLLNIVSGLLRPSEGRLLIDGIDRTRAPPEARNIAQVFQFPVVYDSMTVAENLAFPLRNRRLAPQAVRARVAEIAGLLELESVLTKPARGLSAELKQRISLGRGLVRQDVAAILLDEPLTVIDPHTKWILRRKLMQIHAELRVTLLYVTHDQTEALTLADEVVVMSAGRVLQQGTPRDLFECPAHTFVGYFIGSPGMNLLACTLDTDAAVVAGQRIVLARDTIERARAARAPYVLGIRPERVRLYALRPPEATGLDAEIIAIDELGAAREVTARVGALEVAVKLYDDAVAITPGARCFLELPREWLILYADGRALA